MKEISLKNNYFFIEKNQKHHQIIEQNLKAQSFNLQLYSFVLKVILLNEIKIHFGKFIISDESSFLDLIKIITKVSNYSEKITIIEGSTKKNLNKLLKDNFITFNELKYSEIIADTYYFNYGSSFKEFRKKLKINFNNLKERYKKNKLSDKFSFKEILIIGSLLEKEGLDYNDKKNIYSVIINRLDIKMKLQIDATTIYALTEGDNDLDRELTYDDLKIKHNFNTYHIYGLPPAPISYVGLKTIELILENYKTNYLFYFYNTLESKHIFSINYKKHLNKLNEYRAKK